MSQQKVQPNLLTFNSVLKALRRCGSLAKTQALQTLNEMKAMGIGTVTVSAHTHALSHKLNSILVFICYGNSVSFISLCVFVFSSEPGYLRPHAGSLLQTR